MRDEGIVPRPLRGPSAGAIRCLLRHVTAPRWVRRLCSARHYMAVPIMPIFRPRRNKDVDVPALFPPREHTNQGSAPCSRPERWSTETGG